MSFFSELANESWVVWFVIIGVIIFILWIFAGGGNHEYVGLAPLKIGVDSTKYVNNQTYGIIERSNYNADKVSEIDITPKIKSINETSVGTNSNIFINPNTVCLSNNSNNNITNNNVTNNNTNNIRCSKGEKLCREAIEEIYNKPFPRCRPNFLKNPETKRNLELDCYNDELKIAVEYNGIQHYKWPNFTGQSQEDFVKQIRRDKFKVETCDANGVYLITVPYNVPHEDIKNYIKYYLPENFYQRSDDDKNPNQLYLDLVDYNEDYDFGNDNYSQDYDNSQEYNDNNYDNDDNNDENSDDEDYDNSENTIDNIFSSDEETDDGLMKSYEITFVTNH